MMKIRYAVPLIFSFLLTSCENSTDVNSNLQYQEYTVINAQLSAGNIFQGVTITHTLPLGVQYDIQKAEIKDAVAYIRENGIKIIPIHYVTDGLYKPITNLVINSGEQYELFASVNGNSIYSKTFVPDTPSVVQALNIDNNYLVAEVTAKPNVAYGAAWIVSLGNYSPKASDFQTIMTSENFPANIDVRTLDIPAPYNTIAYSDSFYVQVYAFDKAYKDYFITKSNGNPINNTFTSGGGAVAWNVYGENVIGLFIGVTEGYKVHP